MCYLQSHCFRTEHLNIKAVIKSLESIFNQFGPPHEKRPDNAGSFRDTFKSWGENLGIGINNRNPKNC